MLMRAATVVQQLRKSCRTCFVFYCMFYCVFYFTCDRPFTYLLTIMSMTISQGLLEACNSVREAAGLYQSDVFNYQSDYDTVDKSIQSSRHVDVLKVWLMWRAKGPQGYEAQIEQLMDLSRYDSNVIRCL